MYLCVPRGTLVVSPMFTYTATKHLNTTNLNSILSSTLGALVLDTQL